jgi:hypothetical protein
MRKETPKRKPNPADDLLKTSKTKDVELTERELDKVTGGTLLKAGKDKEYIKITMKDVIIT